MAVVIGHPRLLLCSRSCLLIKSSVSVQLVYGSLLLYESVWAFRPDVSLLSQSEDIYEIVLTSHIDLKSS